MNYSNDWDSLCYLLAIYFAPWKPNQEKNAKYWQYFHTGHVHHVLLHCHIWLFDFLRWAKISLISYRKYLSDNSEVSQVSLLWMCVCVSVCVEYTEAELLHTYSKVDPLDTLILCVRLAVLMAVTLTVPVVLFPVSLAWSCLFQLECINTFCSHLTVYFLCWISWIRLERGDSGTP